MPRRNILPLNGETQTINATDSSSSVTFSTTRPEGKQFRVYNDGADNAFIRLGKGSATAVATTDMPVPAGAIEIFDMGQYDTVAAICAATETATVYVTLCEGRD